MLHSLLHPLQPLLAEMSGTSSSCCWQRHLVRTPVLAQTSWIARLLACLLDGLLLGHQGLPPKGMCVLNRVIMPAGQEMPRVVRGLLGEHAGRRGTARRCACLALCCHGITPVYLPVRAGLRRQGGAAAAEGGQVFRGPSGCGR